ncbi:hypothetical protein EXN66_Car014883 [Channa argus]|uniref:Uncharacterized protein n=1 Tax=Channa argus TaxID=215402 RepID=A0A6G1QAM1_CHAAH|nr:hypothetical protein EXN66_Car014883 [Channa argus]
MGASGGGVFQLMENLSKYEGVVSWGITALQFAASMYIPDRDPSSTASVHTLLSTETQKETKQTLLPVWEVIRGGSSPRVGVVLQSANGLETAQ